MILRKFSVLLLILLSGSSPLFAQSMSDSQVLEYVKEGKMCIRDRIGNVSKITHNGVCAAAHVTCKHLEKECVEIIIVMNLSY